MDSTMNTRDMILTTAPTVDGYRIVKQCGVVYGETVFRHGVLVSLGAKIMNTIDSFKLWSREVAGSMDLIERAREFAYSKMIEEAKRRGANAIIAIESDNTFGGELMYLSLYGTAVQVVPEAEYQAEIEKQRKENEAQLEAQRKKLEAHQSLMLDLEAKRMRGEATPADQFVAEIRDVDSMMEVWKIWQGYGFDESYEEVDKFIRDAKEVERMYGRSSARVEEKKSKIKELLGVRD